MKKQFTKVIAVFLAILMLPGASLFGYLDLDEIFTVEASASEYFTSGYCGEVTETNDGTNLSWVLDNDGTLTITGTGRMRPEAFNIDLRIKSVVIGEGVENIAEKAFYQCSNLISVIMPNTVTEIDIKAFEYCKKLTDINFSAVLHTIDENAFYGTGLQTVVLPDSLSELNRGAFATCYALISVELPDSLKVIEESVFFNCEKLSDITFSESLETIKPYAFHMCKSLTELIFPDSLQTISGSFSGCTGITKIHLGSQFQSFKADTFSSCINIKEITVSENNIYFSAYNNLLYNKEKTELLFSPFKISGEVILPSTLKKLNTDKSISYSVFDNCPEITAFIVEEGNNTLISLDGIIYTADMKTLVACPQGKIGAVNIEEWVELIDYHAFYNCLNITDVTMPDSVITISNSAFYKCTNLQNVSFSQNLKTISSNAFKECISLKSVNLPDSVLTIDFYAFENCAGLTEIEFSDALQTISNSAFSGCSSLTEIVLPDSLTLLGMYVFEKCTALKKVDIGSLTAKIYQVAFDKCEVLEEFIVSQNNTSYSVVDGILYDADKTKLIAVPEAVKGEITIPSTVTTFTYNLIDECEFITAVNVETDSKYLSSVDGIVYTKDKKNLIVCPRGKTGDVDIAEGAETIGIYSFDHCSNITSVNFPSTLLTIENWALRYCSALTDITTTESGSLKTIKSYAFANCQSLKNISLPDTVEYIGAWTFEYCNNLKHFEIPASFTDIENNVFYSCGIESLILPETVRTFGQISNSKIKTLTIENKYCVYTGDAPSLAKNCTVRAYCGSPGHTLATKRLLNFESLGHTYLDWYVYVPATFEAEGIERRDCAYCDGYEERAIAKLQKDVFTATFVANGEVITSVDFPKGATEITEPAVPEKDRYLGEWEDYALSDENITINAIYTLIKSNDASDIKTDSSVIHYSGKDDVLFKLKSSAEATVVKSTITNTVPLDIVLVVDQSGSMDETLGGKTKKVDALKDAATAFVNTVYENGKLTSVDHRISIVGFGLSGNYSGFEKNENTELLTSANGVVRFDRIKPTDYASSLQSVSKNGVVNPELTSAIKGIEARGATAADLGFEMAKGVFANTDSTDRQRVVVFMTDGEPTYASGFQTSVANSAIANAYTLKTAYDASVYSVGVFSSKQSSSNINKFMNAVSSGYPNAKSMTSMGKGTDGQFYTTVEHTDSLASVFKSISTESLSHTAPFDNITIIKTLSDCVTLTSKQEEQLRIDLIRKYGITNDDIIITRNENSTTTIQINSLSPEKVEDDKGNVTYEVEVEFFASLNEKAVTNGEYIVDTEDSGIMLGEDAKGYETTFDISSITLDSEKTRVIFTINGEVYEISENIENGYAVAPEMEISEDWTFVNWKTSSQKATNGLVLDATLIKANRTVTWHTDGEDIIQTYVSGDFISAPEVGANANGDAFLSWNRSIPTTMSDEDLEFTAIYGDHVHNYTSEVTSDMTCLTNGIKTFTCSCGDSYEEAITATGHNYESITPSLEKNDAKCTFVCTYCGDKYDYALDYQVVTASGKRYNVLYEFQLTDDNLNYGFQPDGEIQVRIPLSELHTNARNVTVIRTNDDGTTTKVPAVIEDGFLIITCDHFTPYEVKFDIPCENHIQSEWIITKEATCTLEGSKYIQCTECEAVIIEETIPVAEHIDADNDGFCDIGKEELKTEDDETDTENICNRCGEIHTNFFAKFFCFIKYLIKCIFGF